MKITQKRIYEGENIYSHKKCIRIDVNLEGYCDIPSKDIPDFNYNLIRLIPELKKHRCGIDEDGGFVKRLKEGTYLAHICEHMIIAIQNKLGMDVAYGKAREVQGDSYYIIVQYEYKNTAIKICELAVDVINSLINKNPIDFEGRIDIIKKLLINEQMGPSTKAICDAAKEYNLPITELYGSGIYEIGYGKMGRRIEATIGQKTGCIGVDISCDKLLTKKLLESQNVPVAEGDKVSNIIEALRAAENIGYPVVLKPQFGNKGKDVMLNIKNEKELVESYTGLRKKQKDIIIEQYFEGNDYRVCVVNYEVVAVSLRIKPFVVGNGRDDLRNLISSVNKDSRRGEDHEKPLTKIKFDEDLLRCLEKQNLRLDYIPKDGEKIILRENANLSTGGIAIDCTDDICSENIEYCIDSAKILGLDICGIDICTNDIGIPIDEKRGIVMEVNSAPGIRMHHYPSKGQKRDVGKAIINMLYDGNPKNIPVISVTGTNGKTTTVRLISYVLKKIGYNVGFTSTDGIYINDKCIHSGDDSGFNSAKTILLNHDVDIAVLETARGGIIRKGLAYNLADVGVITNITNDHLGLDGIDSMEELSFVKSLVGEAVKDDGFAVINADDEYSRTIIDRIKAEKIYFSKSKDNDLIQKNISEGKKAVFVEEDSIVIINNKRKYKLADISEVDISYNGHLEYNIENAMAASAALLGLNVDYCMISKGLKEFKSNEKDNSGRFNVYDYYGRKIILDYGHNIEGYRAVISSLEKIKGDNELIGVIGIPGDRKDEVAYEVGKICAHGLDKIVIKEDKDRRGRKPGEIAELLKESIIENKKNSNLRICLDEVQALEYAVNISKKDDTIVVFYENLKNLVEFINGNNDASDCNKLFKA
ncbi:MAG: cyanophycin synthetase [Clostridium sp.]|nr:cyanophycin synthetase [Clostridium sp.]